MVLSSALAPTIVIVLLLVGSVTPLAKVIDPVPLVVDIDAVQCVVRVFKVESIYTAKSVSANTGNVNE